jgi:hypothetical protein
MIESARTLNKNDIVLIQARREDQRWVEKTKEKKHETHHILVCRMI